MDEILEIKFRIAVFGLKSVHDSKDKSIFDAVINNPDFEGLVRTFEKACDEACKDQKLKQKFCSVIGGIKELRGAKEVEDLFKDRKFSQAVKALEEIYIAIYGKTGEYDSEYQHFRQEIKRIADSQPAERKTSSVSMWWKGIIGLAITAAVGGAYYLKKRKKENAEK